MRAVSVGTATIEAASEGVTASATVVVRATPVAAVVASESAIQLLPPESRQLSAIARGPDGEILSGRTHDKNIAQVASWLQVQGIRLAEVRVVPDVEERIVAAVNALRTTHDYLFTTGGIGPTHDDISVDAVAKALGVPVVIHPEARRILEDYYATRGGLTDARLRMARVPEGADLIPNRMSGAPGIRIGNVHMMAGVPHIAAQMLDALTGTLEGGAPLLSETVGGWIKESEVADILREVERAHEGCQIGSYPFFRNGEVGANFVIRSTDPDALRSCVDSLCEALGDAGLDFTPGGI